MTKKFKDTDMQAVIGWILRAGVLVSMSVIFIGGVIYLYRHGQAHVDYSKFVGVPDLVSNPGAIIHGVFTLRGRAIIQTGIILLIATPVIRVIFSAIGFIMEKDYLYTAITILVLFIILASMISGHAG